MTRQFIDLSKLPKDQARVLIAQDVLKQIKAGKIAAVAGSYLILYNASGKEQFHEVLESASDCEVCALGSLMYSRVLLADKMNCSGFRKHLFIDRSDLDDMKELLKYFETEELAKIELFFEGYSTGNYAGIHIQSAENRKQAYDFLIKFPEQNRLQKIMQNIIDNGGTFVPEKL